MCKECKVDTKSENFVAEFHPNEINFYNLYDKLFVVMVSTGDRNTALALPSTMHGPYSFLEMIRVVAKMHQTHQHHAKVFIPATDEAVSAQWLDSGTTDYIECFYETIENECLLDLNDATRHLQPGLLGGHKYKAE